MITDTQRHARKIGSAFPCAFPFFSDDSMRFFATRITFSTVHKEWGCVEYSDTFIHRGERSAPYYKLAFVCDDGLAHRQYKTRYLRNKASAMWREKFAENAAQAWEEWKIECKDSD